MSVLGFELLRDLKAEAKRNDLKKKTLDLMNGNIKEKLEKPDKDIEKRLATLEKAVAFLLEKEGD